MKNIIKHLGVTALATSLAFAAIASLGVTPASAATACRTNTRTLNLPGKPDITLKVELCVSGSGTYRHAEAKFSWTGSWGTTGGTRVNLMYVYVALEQNDAWRASSSGYYAGPVNSTYSGSVTLGATKSGSLSSGGWTADGKVQYDITDDGNQPVNWELYGSPVIS